MMLDHLDPNSLTWRVFVDWLDAEVDTLRKQNDNPGLGMIETAALRGRIAQLLEIKTLGEARKGPRLVTPPGPDAR